MKESDDVTFTGERLHADEGLFSVDLIRHRAAYVEAIRRASELRAEKILELGSGTGYGANEISDAGFQVLAVDRVAPPKRLKAETTARFLQADLEALPLRSQFFDLVLSFQVIEHLEDPTLYLDALARHLVPGGTALITTPNSEFSDGQNPFHVHEYEATELERVLKTRFNFVEMLGVSARGEALRYHEERLRRIEGIMRIDPFGLRHHLPRPLLEWIFARLAVLVRSRIKSSAGLPTISLDDFPIETVHPRSLDLLALCREPILR